MNLLHAERRLIRARALAVVKVSAERCFLRAYRFYDLYAPPQANADGADVALISFPIEKKPISGTA